MSTTLPPAANDPAVPTLVLPGKGLSAGAGVSWIGEGWKLFTQAPLMWVVFTVLLLILMVVSSLIPIIGTIVFQVLLPVLAAGVVLGCWSLENGGELEIEHLFAGFKRHFKELVIVGAIYLVGSLAIILVFAAFVGFSVIPAIMMGGATGGDPMAAFGAMGVGFVIGTLVCTALLMLLMAAYWFAPALVVMHGMAPVAAMKASFFACFRNFLPFLIYSILMFIGVIVAMIPIGLGLLVWAPLLFTSTYRAYRQIFTEEA